MGCARQWARSVRANEILACWSRTALFLNVSSVMRSVYASIKVKLFVHKRIRIILPYSTRARFSCARGGEKM
jgi:hypothetical protein